MANSTTVTADGVQTDFSVPFPFLDRAHVKVRLSGVLQSPPAYSWLTASSIRFSTPPPYGAMVYISRETPLTPVTDFSDGATLDANSLDRAIRQPLYLVEDLEAGDTSIEAGAILADAYAYTNAREVAIRADFPTGGGGGPSAASAVTVADSSDYFVGTTVESALAEVGAKQAALASPSYLTLGTSPALSNERRLVQGANITITDGGPGGDVVISATGGGGGTPAANAVAIADAGGLIAGTNVEDALQEVAGKASVVKSLTRDFGGVGNNVVDNAGAIAAAIASPAPRVYVPEGAFYTSGSLSTLIGKKFYGPGTFRAGASGYRPGDYSAMATRPAAGTGVDMQYFFSGDLSKIEAEYHQIGTGSANIRKGLSEPYFESSTTPHFQWFQNFSGWSGVTARLASPAVLGATVLALNNATGIAVGNTLGIRNETTGVVAQTLTVTNVSGNNITVSPALSAAYGINTVVTHGERTMNPLVFQEVIHEGGGDSYAIVARGIGAYQALPGQSHFFDTATTGLFGGDLNATRPYNFLTGIEINHSDLGNDIACSGLILNFQRTVSTGARGQVWRGILMKSEDTEAIDTFISVSGKSKVGLDLVMGNYGASQCAIGLAANQRIYFDNTAAADNTGLYTHYGNTLGQTYQVYDGSVMKLFVEGGLSYSCTQNYFEAGVDLGTQRNVYVVEGNKVLLDGRIGSTYWNGSGTAAALRVGGSLLMLASNNGGGDTKLGFFGATGANKPTVTGSRGGNAALASLISALASLGLITNSTTA